jgi:hypothetical protein
VPTSLAILSAQHPWLFLFVPLWLILLPVATGTGEGLRDLVKGFLTKLSSPTKAPREKTEAGNMMATIKPCSELWLKRRGEKRTKFMSGPTFLTMERAMPQQRGTELEIQALLEAQEGPLSD